jgi:hypothetical protein
MEREMKLPKQWKHWVYRLGLKENKGFGKDRKKYSKFYLNGFNRLWRINCLNQFQYSEKLDTFDRWSNSTEGTFPIPQSFKEFEFIVKKAREK